MTCARCGAQNPDGNSYCQACGTPLMVQVPAGAAQPGQPSWLASPPPPAPPQFSTPQPQYAPPAQFTPQPQYAPPAPAYQSPYYSPSGPTAPVQRGSWTMLIGPVLIICVILGGVGAAFAIIRNQSNTPVVTTQDTATSNYSPPPGATVVSNAGVQLTLPPGWTVVSKDAETIIVTDSLKDGAVTVGSGPSNPSRTAQQDMDTVNQTLRSKYPDTRVCPGRPVVSSSFNGVKGLYWTLCFTVTSGAQSVPGVASMFAGANADGSVAYLLMAVTPEGNLTTFTTEDRDLLQSIVWKLT